MSEVTVTVRGEHEARIAPERATVHVSVRAEGPERTAVVESVMRLAERVRSSITERADAGSVIDWTSKRLSVRAERPWSNDGKRLAPVYYTSIDFTVTFAEATELSIWVSDISPWDGIEVGWVQWHLTPTTRTRLERDVAAEAVRVAITRAKAYAGALGLDEVTPLEIADVGLISSGHPVPGAPMLQERGGAAFAANIVQQSDLAQAMEYEPEEIVISATVEARFLAR